MAYRRTFIVEFDEDTPMPSDVVVSAVLRGTIVGQAPNDMIEVMDALICAVEQEVADDALNHRLLDRVAYLCAVHADPGRFYGPRRHLR